MFCRLSDANSMTIIITTINWEPSQDCIDGVINVDRGGPQSNFSLLDKNVTGQLPDHIFQLQ